MTVPYPRPRPWSTSIPEDRKWDAIVIGSGIGGMTTAGILAANGRQVLVLEQHYVPGGYTHVFQRKGFVWDVGVHLVGQMVTKTLPGRVLHALAGDELSWTPVGSPYDTFRFPDADPFAFPDHPDAFLAMLCERFPHEAKGIYAYWREVSDTMKALRGWFASRATSGLAHTLLGAPMARSAHAALEQPAMAVIAKHIADPKLRTLLTAQWGYHGTPPHKVSWAVHAAVVKHFAYGAYYPKHTAANIARGMLDKVAQAGGWTTITANVDQILVEGGRTVGVQLDDGRQARAPVVISAAGANTTAGKLLPPEERSSQWAAAVRRFPSGPAHVALYVGFEGDIAPHGATRAAQWTYDRWEHGDRQTWAVDPSAPTQTPPPVLFTSFPSLKDPGHDPGPKQRHTGEIVTFVPWEAFGRWQGTPWRKRGEGYEAFKQGMTEAILDVVRPQAPDLWSKAVHMELGTPLSSEVFAAPFRGSIYGLTHTPDRMLSPHLRAATPVPGLYLSGTDVALCGIAGGLTGGVLAAMAVDPIGTMGWMRRLG